ncbi:hypothetical protein HY488_02625 [Candidatus Woesearchaeota archaeon]|nr:hypothetical protein [Candidatus Woesearchaeota archaeon]
MGQKRGVTLFSSKRALSPLIATVMLIAFAVALGAVVMNWGKGYIEESGVLPEGEIELAPATPPAAPCEQAIQLQVLTIAGRQDICFDTATNVLNYRFENNGQVAIEGGKMQVIGATDVLETEIEAMSIAAIKRGSVPYDPAQYGQVQKAKVVPKVDGQLCPQKALNVEEIGICI